MPLMQFVAPPRTPRKAETRLRLLDAALELVAEKGFGNASLADIAARAGVTTGAVYSNFRSKEALLLELIEQQMQGAPELPEDYPPAGDPDKPVLEHMVDTAVAAARFVDRPQSRRLAILQVELLAMAIRERSLQRRLRRESRELTSRLARTLQQLGDVPEPAPPTPEQLAQVFSAGLSGLQQLRLLHPEAAPDALFEWFVRAILFAARSGRGVTAERPASRRGSRR